MANTAANGTGARKILFPKIFDGFATQEPQNTDLDLDQDVMHAEIEADMLLRLCQEQTDLYFALLNMDSGLTIYEKHFSERI